MTALVEVRRWVPSLAIASIIVGICTFAFDTWSRVQATAYIADLQAEPSENWLVLTSTIVSDGTQEVEPRIALSFDVVRTVKIRINSQPRNLETGEVVCPGRTITVVYDPQAASYNVPMSALAGLDRCDWPPGRYAASLTWTMTDEQSNVQLKPIAIETNEFAVLPAAE